MNFILRVQIFNYLQMTDKNEFNRLSLDLVSSYIITLFGNYMEEIVDITKNIFSNSDIMI